MKVAARMPAQTRVTNPVAQRACHDPSLRDPARQKTARKKSPGRSGRDDRREDSHKSAASGGRYEGEEKGKFRSRSEDRPLGRQEANAREEHQVRVQRRCLQTHGNSLIPEKGELQDYRSWQESQGYIEEDSAPAAGLL
jgi:hypothetical protein